MESANIIATGFNISKIVQFLEKWTTKISKVFAHISGILVLFGTALLLAEITSRIITGNSLDWQYEAVTYLEVIWSFLAISYTQSRKSHISITLLTDYLNDFEKSIWRIFETLCCIVFISIFTTSTYGFALDSVLIRETGYGVWSPPIYPVKLIMAICLTVFLIQLLADIISQINNLTTKARQIKTSNYRRLIIIASSFIVALAIGVLLLLFIPQIAIFWIFIVLILFGIPIYAGMGIGSLIGLFFAGGTANIVALTLRSFNALTSYVLICVPLFMLAGMTLERTAMISRLFNFVRNIFGRIVGALGITTIGCSAFFAAISASDISTSATVGVIAYPQLKENGYKPGFAAALIAAGGTLGPLIPPSGILVMYAMMTQLPLGKLLLAGVFPGLLVATLFSVFIYFYCRINRIKEVTNKATNQQKRRSFAGALPALVFPVIILGGIYSGLFTATECAAISVLYAFVVTFSLKWLKLKQLPSLWLSTTELMGAMVGIFFGAMSFGVPVSLLQIPNFFTELVSKLCPNSVTLIFAIFIVFLILGMLMDSMSMILIFIPFLYPIVVASGVDPIWFGIFIVIVCEIGVLTPPVGMLLFVLQMITKLKFKEIAGAIWPFVLILSFTILLLWFFPQIATWLPNVSHAGS